MSDDGGNARKGKLQIGHMYATQIDVVGFYETVVGIIDAKILQNVERGDEHTATAATGIAYCDDFVFVDFFPNNRFVYGHPCHKFRDKTIILSRLLLLMKTADVLTRNLRIKVQSRKVKKMFIAELLRKILITDMVISYRQRREIPEITIPQMR